MGGKAEHNPWITSHRSYLDPFFLVRNDVLPQRLFPDRQSRKAPFFNLQLEGPYPWQGLGLSVWTRVVVYYYLLRLPLPLSADDLILVLFPNRATIGSTVIRSTSTAARRTGCMDSISVYFSLIRFLMSES